MIGTISAVVQSQMDEAEGYIVQGWKKGADTMSSWITIIFAYVIIGVAIFNLVGSGSHLLF